MSADVYRLVERLYPNVRLESPVQGWVFLRDFVRGLECYESLPDKRGIDDRWAGICYFHLQQDLRAVELFYRAISRGADAARINLAHALGFIERGDEVIPQLLEVEKHRLTTYDKVLYHRVKSIHEETNGDLDTALQDANKAWQLVQGIPEHTILAPEILSQLAVLHGRIGKAQRALHLINECIAVTSGVGLLRAKLHKANILISLGRFAEANAELKQAESWQEAPSSFRAIADIYKGQAEWALGNIKEAIHRFEMAAEVAAEFEIGFEEFLARLDLALLYSTSREIDTAFEQLNHAEKLVSDRSDRLYYRFRELVIRRAAARVGTDEAVATLESVSDELGKMGALQEQGYVRLHIAYEHWLIGSTEYEKELYDLIKLAKFLNNPGFLARELVLLPEFSDIALRYMNQGSERLTLSLLTLNADQMLLNGAPLQLPVRRAVEILAYFVEKQQASLDALLNDLFPNVKKRTARSYFHQFRCQLKCHLPGVAITYDRSASVYRLESSIPILWDVNEVRANQLEYRGQAFLPGSHSPWCARVNEKLRDKRVLVER